MNNVRLLLVSLACLMNYSLCSAQIAPEQQAKIDSLFLEWNSPNHPGGAVGIMQEGKIVYQKAFGLSSMEYLVPNTFNTIYNIASVSKQFTAMGMVLLENQGKLSLDDDVHIHLPWLPDFGETITLRQMLNHTSGMRSLHALLALAGWRGDDSRTNADIDRFMTQQTALNFKPGAEYLYCNTGFMLMADIIEDKTGLSFPNFMRQKVFEPLGMVHSYVEPDYANIIPGNATSYYGSSADGFEQATPYWGYVGSGNMHSTTTDLLIWLENYIHPTPGWEQAFEKMQVNGLLNNGEKIPYALGVNVGTYNGHKKIEHGGSIGGFRASAASYPDDEMNVVVLANFSSSSVGQKVNDITNLLLDLHPEKKPTPAKTETLVYKASSKEMKSITGVYYSPELETSYRFYMEGDRLEAYHTRHGVLTVGWETQDILDVEWPLNEVVLIKDKKGKISGIKVFNGRVKGLWMEKIE